MSSSSRQAARQLDLKLALEVRMKPKLVTIFRRIAREFRISVAATGRPQGAQRYRAAFAALIDAHDVKVQAAFTARALRMTKAAAPDDEEGNEEALLLLLLLWRTERAEAASQAITATNEREMQEAISQARSQLQEQQLEAIAAGKSAPAPTNREVAALAAVLLLRRFKVRVPLIALVETQAAAESTKYIEFGEVTENGLQTKPRKKWATVGDTHVRPSHAAANGQVVDFDAPFIVGGSLLQYPGDSSLGASAAEVMNCRCAALYTEGEE